MLDWAMKMKNNIRHAGKVMRRWNLKTTAREGMPELLDRAVRMQGSASCVLKKAVFARPVAEDLFTPAQNQHALSLAVRLRLACKQHRKQAFLQLGDVTIGVGSPAFKFLPRTCPFVLV